MGVDSGGTLGEATLEIGEAVAPAVTLLVESAVELRQFIEDELEVGLYGAMRPLKLGVVVARMEVGV